MFLDIFVAIIVAQAISSFIPKSLEDVASSVKLVMDDRLMINPVDDSISLKFI